MSASAATLAAAAAISVPMLDKAHWPRSAAPAVAVDRRHVEDWDRSTLRLMVMDGYSSVRSAGEKDGGDALRSNIDDPADVTGSADGASVIASPPSCSTEAGGVEGSNAGLSKPKGGSSGN